MNTPKIRFKGFKDDWEQRKLSEICERITRKNRNNESDLPLTIASQFGLIDQRDFFNKVVAAKDMSNYYLLKKGEFAYNKSYSNGFDYGSIKRLNAYKQGCLSTLYICFGITSDEVESDYLECFFDTLKWYGDLSMICAEGARNHGLLNVDTKGFFDEVTVDLPKSLEEQKRISVYMNALNRLITLHQRKCDETKQLKKFMLQKMFPKNGEKNPEIRFEGFTDDWEQRKLEDVMDTVTDYVAAGSFEDIRNNVTYLNEPGYAQLVRTVDLKKKFTNNDSVYVDESAFKYLWRVNLNDECIVLPNIGANIGEVYFVEPSGLPYDNNVLGPNAILLKANEDTYFAFTALNNLTFQKQLFENVGSSGQPKFNKTELKSIQLYMPQNEEQVKIGQYFRKLDHLITLHQRKCEKLKELKKFMLQNMFV